MSRKQTAGLAREEICAKLGISPRTLRRKVKSGEIKMARVRGKYVYWTTEKTATAAPLDAAIDMPSYRSPIRVEIETEKESPDVPSMVTLPQEKADRADVVPKETHAAALKQIKDLSDQVASLSEAVGVIRGSLGQEKKKVSELEAKLETFRRWQRKRTGCKAELIRLPWWRLIQRLRLRRRLQDL